MKTKKQQGIEQLSKHIHHIRCPICRKSFEETATGVVCPDRHSYDVAKQGYLNLAGQVGKSRYTKELFTARQALLEETKFFTPLIEEIVLHLQRVNTSSAPTIVDMGCGEGTHLAGIVEPIPQAMGLGIDLAKEGIRLASNHEADVLWLVADLAKSPVQDHSIDVVLNILSPANHQEFRRILKPRGLVVKVVPNAGYLKELREHFYAGTDKESFENEEAEARFASELELVTSVDITYSKPLTQKQWRDLISMTPLTWNAPKDDIDAFLTKEISSVTIDLKVMIGRV